MRVCGIGYPHAGFFEGFEGIRILLDLFLQDA